LFVAGIDWREQPWIFITANYDKAAALTQFETAAPHLGFQMPPKSKSTKGKAGTRKYGPKASSKVGTAMRRMKKGKLKSGKSGKPVKSRSQAVAIGLSEARKSGAKVPPKKRSHTKSS
jgi:Family of unknown function (DUF6496)